MKILWPSILDTGRACLEEKHENANDYRPKYSKLIEWLIQMIA